jgi:hypothetical protein
MIAMARTRYEGMMLRGQLPHTYCAFDPFLVGPFDMQNGHSVNGRDWISMTLSRYGPGTNCGSTRFPHVHPIQRV